MKIRDDKYFILKNKSGEIMVEHTSYETTYEFCDESTLKQAKLPLMLEIVYVSKETYEDIKNRTVFDGENNIKISDLTLVPISLTLEIL